ncbi:MAG: hypothetical protein U9N14_00855, partial [Pseudomonadota bacterium]|nr:hypothetical protein [Pseudomonadota bacterium]
MPGSALAQVALDTRGQVKLNSTIAFPTHRGLFADIGSKPLHDFSLTTRLVNRLDMTPDTCLDVDLQTSAAFGDSLHRGQKLQNAEPVLFPEGLAAPMRDEARFMDLTAVRTSGDTVETYRLDRLAVTHLTRWGSITLGRQALTLGNGMAFNVMDLFNPFSPTDLDKDYKTGNDMAVLRAGLSPNADVQLIYVPRRNAATHQHDWDQDSWAAHLHLLGDMAEFDFMLAKHYRDTVTGVGIRSDMLGTAWRIDGTLTFLNARPGRDKVIHPALVANLDRSW